MDKYGCGQNKRNCQWIEELFMMLSIRSGKGEEWEKENEAIHQHHASLIRISRSTPTRRRGGRRIEILLLVKNEFMNQKSSARELLTTPFLSWLSRSIHVVSYFQWFPSDRFLHFPSKNPENIVSNILQVASVSTVTIFFISGLFKMSFSILQRHCWTGKNYNFG